MPSRVRHPFQRRLLSPHAAAVVSALAERPLDMRLLRSRCFPQAAPTQASAPLRRVSFAFRRGLIARPYRIADIRRTSRRLATTRTTWASSSVSVVSRCAQAMPPDTLAIRERYPNTRPRRSDHLRRLRLDRERSPSPWPKRDTSRTIPAWPLRHRQLPVDAGCVPGLPSRPPADAPTLTGSSGDFRTGSDPPG